MPDEQLVVAILAAGASRRLGQPKQLVLIDGEPLLRRQCQTSLAADIGPVVAILGCHAGACARAIADLPVEVRINPDWHEGLSASVRQAVRAARDRRAGGLLLLHGDQYRITPADLRALDSAWRGSPVSACVSRCGAYTGPPAILPAACYEGALALAGDRGARTVLYDPSRPAPVEIDNPHAPFDLDHPHQLAAVRSSGS